MARQSADREDLMAEAVALSPRMAFSIAGRDEEFVAGRRADGSWSIYLNGDPVYQFDNEDRLRRAFVAGHLYRSQRTTLARLTRQNTDTETILQRHDLDPDELAGFLGQMCQDLASIRESIQQAQVTVHQSIPADANYLPEFQSRLASVLSREISLSPMSVRRITSSATRP